MRPIHRMVTGMPQSKVAIWRPGHHDPGSPYGDQDITTLGRHMATGTTQVWVAIWQRLARNTNFLCNTIDLDLY